MTGILGGVAAGAIIGQDMDKQAAELEKDLKDAEIERVGEGIQITFNSGILFDFDAAGLRTEARENLSTLAESLQDYPNTELMIVGHTDSRGAEDYNQDLSLRRANSAAGHLVTQGVPRDRMTILGKGETEPVASNDTDAGRQQNRRVEVAIYASEEYREEVSGQN
ncbi:MAG: OmpA family protein [Bacteroidetes bacterium]|nr:OmpA family protein [Bacteroidota bacterium]